MEEEVCSYGTLCVETSPLACGQCTKLVIVATSQKAQLCGMKIAKIKYDALPNKPDNFARFIICSNVVHYFIALAFVNNMISVAESGMLEFVFSNFESSELFVVE
jgi:hypothetical protein